MSRSAEAPRSRQGRATRVRDLLRSQIFAEKPLRLPSEEELARDYGVSRNTMREALALLVDEGVLSRSKGIGTTLIVERHTRAYDTEAGLAAALPQLTPRIEHTNVDLELVPTTPYLRARFGPEEESFVYWERITLVAGVPHTIWRSHLPATAFGSLVTDPPASGASIYELVHELTGAPVARTRRIVEARPTDPMSARLLRVPPGTPAMHIERSMLSVDGRLLELGYAWVRGDRYAVTYDTEHGGDARPAGEPGTSDPDPAVSVDGSCVPPPSPSPEGPRE